MLVNQLLPSAISICRTKLGKFDSEHSRIEEPIR